MFVINKWSSFQSSFLQLLASPVTMPSPGWNLVVACGASPPCRTSWRLMNRWGFCGVGQFFHPTSSGVHFFFPASGLDMFRMHLWTRFSCVSPGSLPRQSGRIGTAWLPPAIADEVLGGALGRGGHAQF